MPAEVGVDRCDQLIAAATTGNEAAAPVQEVQRVAVVGDSNRVVRRNISVLDDQFAEEVTKPPLVFLVLGPDADAQPLELDGERTRPDRAADEAPSRRRGIDEVCRPGQPLERVSQQASVIQLLDESPNGIRRLGHRDVPNLRAVERELVDRGGTIEEAPQQRPDGIQAVDHPMDRIPQHELAADVDALDVGSTGRSP